LSGTVLIQFLGMRPFFGAEGRRSRLPKAYPQGAVPEGPQKPKKSIGLNPLPQRLKQLFHALPKTELHMHLPGSTPLNILQGIMREKGWSESKIKRESHLKAKFHDLNDFLKTYYRVTGHLQNPSDFQKAAFVVTKECAEENVRYFEVRASILHKGAEPDKIVSAIEKGLKEGIQWVKENYGRDIKAGLIVLAQRSGSPEDSLKSAEWAVKLAQKRGSMICGFDLAGSETDHAPLRHQKALRYVKAHHLPLTVHAGETETSSCYTGAESIRQAIQLGADRIGHGLQLIKLPFLLKRFQKNKTPVELAPWTNVQLKSVKNFQEHPLPLFLEKGLNVSLNTDNRMLSKITLSDQLGMLYQHGVIQTWAQLKTLMNNGIQGAFLNAFQKKRLEKQMNQEFLALEKSSYYQPVIRQYLSGSQGNEKTGLQKSR
jgi:adenosine deaminase